MPEFSIDGSNTSDQIISICENYYDGTHYKLASITGNANNDNDVTFDIVPAGVKTWDKYDLVTIADNASEADVKKIKDDKKTDDKMDFIFDKKIFISSVKKRVLGFGGFSS